VHDDRATLSLSGRFDFSAHGEFRRHYEEVMKQAGVKGLDVDLGGVDYIDSSALGMLLLLKESADRARHQTYLNVRPEVN
jgi:anti-anti-sigma factor